MTPAAPECLDLFPEFVGTYRFTSDQYHRLIDAGIVGPADHVELMDGYILLKPDYADLPPGAGPYSDRLWLRKWTVAEYHRMSELGILTPDDKLELLDGDLVPKMGQNAPHSSTLDRLAEDVRAVVPAGWRVRSQMPVTLSASEPEPDLAVVRGGRRTFDHRQPGAGDFGIVVEVSDTTLADDRRKGQTYARDGIPVYWIVNVEDGQVEVYADPDQAATPPTYRARTDYRPGQDVPIILDGQVAGTIPAADLLP